MKRFHRNESGAVALMVMAGALIVLLTAMLMYDAGESSRERMDVQIGADTAALSGATVRARSMNMISYANITKRILYGYTTLYTAAVLALLEAVGYYSAATLKHAKDAKMYIECTALVIPAAECAPLAADSLLATAETGVTAAEGMVQLVVELIEFFAVNAPRLYGTPGGDTENGRSMVEVEALNLYQQYTKQLAPWWTWGEAVTRGVRNGATYVGTYPIPEGDATKMRDRVAFVLNSVGAVLGNGGGGDGNITLDEDSLPLEQIPKMSDLGPYFPAVTSGKLYAHMRMCGRTLFSPEFWLMQYAWDHWKTSKGYWDDTKGPHKRLNTRHPAPRTMVTTLEIMQLPVGCVMAVGTMGNTALPFEISVGVAELPGSQGRDDATNEGWLKASQNVVLAYKEGQGRFGARRSKMTFVGPETGTWTSPLYQNGGYWAIAKAEMVWDPTFLGDMSSEVSSAVGGIPFAKNVAGVISNFNNAPSMWDPRWTSRLRPFTLPDEDESVTDLRLIYHDALAMMVAGAPFGFAYKEGDGLVDSGVNTDALVREALSETAGFIPDVIYMERAARGYDAEHLKTGYEK